MKRPVDWSLPIENDEEVPKALVAHERVDSEGMRWVEVVGGQEGWDGWYAKDDGTPKFDEESGGPDVRNRTHGIDRQGR